MDTRRGIVVTACALALGAAPGGAGAGEPRRIGLDELIARARSSPRVDEARAAERAAAAKAGEARWGWLPALELTALGAPIRAVECLPSTDDCARTEPADLAPGLDGFAWRVDATLVLPIYGFGKRGAGLDAADAGARAAGALGDAAEADAALDAARAYYAVKAAREARAMLETGREALAGELARVEAALERGAGDATESDRYRLRAALAEIDARLADARQAEASALAAVRALWGDGSTEVDVDDTPLAPLAADADLGSEADAVAAARANRAELRAARAGADARDALADLERARWWPDLYLFGRGSFAQAAGADDPDNLFLADPLNGASLVVGVGLRWAIEPGVRAARVRGARAEAGRAGALAAQVDAAVALEAADAWARAAAARARLAAAADGEKAARAWLVAAAEASDAGLGEPRDLSDAVAAYFAMRGRHIQAMVDWNLGLFTLARATGRALPQTK